MDIKEEFEKFKAETQAREKVMLERLDKLEKVIKGLAYNIGSIQNTLADEYEVETGE